MKLLVVDDDPISRSIMVMALKNGGYQTLEADTGLKAMNVLNASEPISVLLLDVMMPDMSGLELLDQVRESPHLRRIPAIICSSAGTRDVVEDARRLNVVDFLVKPVDAATLRRAIDAVVRKEPKVLAHHEHTRQRLELSRKDLLSLLRAFVEQLEQLCQAVESRQNDEAPSDVASQASAVKGAADTLGATRVSRVLADSLGPESPGLDARELRHELALLRGEVELLDVEDEAAAETAEDSTPEGAGDEAVGETEKVEGEAVRDAEEVATSS